MVEDGASQTEYAIVEGFKPGKKIRIGSVTAGDMIEWSEANEGEAKRTAGLRLICKSLVNDAGIRISSDKDIVKLRTMRHNVSERIVKEILKLNGMNVKADDAAKKD
jgi:molybdopterin-guanine dinucleotide biosynthesis protein